jgi:hypothetical protein
MTGDRWKSSYIKCLKRDNYLKVCRLYVQLYFFVGSYHQFEGSDRDRDAGGKNN